VRRRARSASLGRNVSENPCRKAPATVFAAALRFRRIWRAAPPRVQGAARLPCPSATTCMEIDATPSRLDRSRTLANACAACSGRMVSRARARRKSPRSKLHGRSRAGATEMLERSSNMQNEAIANLRVSARCHRLEVHFDPSRRIVTFARIPQAPETSAPAAARIFLSGGWGERETLGDCRARAEHV
jgi:hypothetical protein